MLSLKVLQIDYYTVDATLVYTIVMLTAALAQSFSERACALIEMTQNFFLYKIYEAELTVMSLV